jgi:hypothetical protein
MVGEHHPLANVSAVGIQDLEPYPMVLLDIPWSREYFLSLFIPAGVTPNIVMRSSNLETVRAMVGNGIGYSIANARPKGNISQDGKRLIRIRLAGVQHALQLGYATASNAQPAWPHRASSTPTPCRPLPTPSERPRTTVDHPASPSLLRIFSPQFHARNEFNRCHRARRLQAQDQPRDDHGHAALKSGARRTAA